MESIQEYIWYKVQKIWGRMVGMKLDTDSKISKNLWKSEIWRKVLHLIVMWPWWAVLNFLMPSPKLFLNLPRPRFCLFLFALHFFIFRGSKISSQVLVSVPFQLVSVCILVVGAGGCPDSCVGPALRFLGGCLRRFVDQNFGHLYTRLSPKYGVQTPRIEWTTAKTVLHAYPILAWILPPQMFHA